jgi:hypothetical protein
MIVDVNAHWGPYAFRHLPDHDGPGLMRLMDRWGVDHALLCSNPSLLYRDAHQGDVEMSRAIAPHPGRFSGVATINPAYPGWNRDLETALDDWNFRAVRLVPQFHGYALTDPCADALAAECARRDVPILFMQQVEDRRQMHPWDRAENLAIEPVLAFARRHERVRICLCNWLGLGGRELTDAGLAGRVLIDLARFDVVLFRSLPRLIDEIGIGAIAFGSQAPFNYIPPALIRLECLDLSEEDRERVAWKNAAEFFSLERMNLHYSSQEEKT